MDIKDSVRSDCFPEFPQLHVVPPEVNPSVLVTFVRRCDFMERTAVVHVEPVEILFQVMPEPAGVVLLDGIFIAADVRRDADLQAVGVFDQFTKRLFIVRNAAVLNIQPPVFMHCQNLASAFRHDAEAFGVRVMAEVVEVMIQCHRWKMPFYRSVPDDESPVVTPLPWQIVMTAGIFLEVPADDGISVLPCHRGFVVFGFAGNGIASLHEKFCVELRRVVLKCLKGDHRHDAVFKDARKVSFDETLRRGGLDQSAVRSLRAEE